MSSTTKYTSASTTINTTVLNTTILNTTILNTTVLNTTVPIQGTNPTTSTVPDCTDNAAQVVGAVLGTVIIFLVFVILYMITRLHQVQHKNQESANPNVNQHLDQPSQDQAYYSSVVYSASNIGFNSGLSNSNSAASCPGNKTTLLANQQETCYSQVDSEDILLGGTPNPGAVCVMLESTDAANHMYIDVI